MDYKEELKNEIASFIGCEKDEVILTWKGRVALYGILKSLSLSEGAEVIIPAFTCVVVPNAILYHKLKPVYVDIDPVSYNIDVKELERSITNKTKVILAQNTFGLSSDLDKIKRIAEKYNLIVIEDCTHGFGGSYKGKLNGTNVDAAFFSSQWNKMFSTAIGGFAIIKNTVLKEKLNEFEKTLQKPSSKDELLLKLQLKAKKILGYKSLYWNAMKLYRYLSEKNLVIGSSSGGEMETIEMPEDYLKGFSNTQSKKGVFEIKRISENLMHRKKIASFYDETLLNLGKKKAYSPNDVEHTYTKYPILVKNRERFLKRAEKYKIPIHDWFISQIHPITENFHRWSLTPNEHPISKKIAGHIVNLPTDLSVDYQLKKKVARFLEINKDQIVSYDDL